MVKYARFIYLHSQQKQKNQCTYIFDRDFMTGHNEHAYMYLSNINIRDVGNRTGMFYYFHEACHWRLGHIQQFCLVRQPTSSKQLWLP